MNDSIGERLRVFAKKKYGTVRALCDALEIKEQTLQPYLSNKSKPGHALQEKLRNLGADIEWLMTGREPSAQSQSLPDNIEDIIKLQDETIELLQSEVRLLREQVDEYRSRVRNLTNNNIVLITNAAATPPEEEE